MRRSLGVCAIVLCVLVLSVAVNAAAQVNTATLSGAVTDPQGLAVRGAQVTVTSATTGAQRTIVADEAGRYIFIGLPPGQYKMTVRAGSFSVFQHDSVVVTVGEDATLNPRLSLTGMSETVTVTGETAAIETSKTEVSQTVEQRSIDNLPINGRGYINFTLINSQTTRDVSPTIGPAPNSGLNINGARARSNMVSVDGADAVDNSVNGIRATVSQEAVQEFQLFFVITMRNMAAPPVASSTSSPRAAPTRSTATFSAISATNPSNRETLSPVRSIPLPAFLILSNKLTHARSLALR